MTELYLLCFLFLLSMYRVRAQILPITMVETSLPAPGPDDLSAFSGLEMKKNRTAAISLSRSFLPVVANDGWHLVLFQKGSMPGAAMQLYASGLAPFSTFMQQVATAVAKVNSIFGHTAAALSSAVHKSVTASFRQACKFRPQLLQTGQSGSRVSAAGEKLAQPGSAIAYTAGWRQLYAAMSHKRLRLMPGVMQKAAGPSASIIQMVCVPGAGMGCFGVFCYMQTKPEPG